MEDSRLDPPLTRGSENGMDCGVEGERRRPRPSSGDVSSESSSVDESEESILCTSPSQKVSFQIPIADLQCDKDQPKYLTAKYPKNKRGLVRKKLAVEDWIDEELSKFYGTSEQDQVDLDLDELLRLATDEEREAHIKKLLNGVPTAQSAIAEFVEELLVKSRALS